MVQLTSKRRQVQDELQASKFAYDQGWTDGLPIVVPTPERVAAFLEHASLAPETVVGRYDVRNRSVPAEKVAINAVMAGCRPEYFPVVVAAIQAITDPSFHLNHLASTSSPYPFFIVNGPIVEALGMDGDGGAFAPGCHSRATIGRAVALTLANCLEARVGAVQQGVLGAPWRCGGGVIAERADTGWEPLSVQYGAPAGTSTVTALSNVMVGPQEVVAHPPQCFPDAESLAGFLAEHFAEYNMICMGGAHLLLLSPPMQRRFQSEGWSKQMLRQWLIEHTRISFARMIRKSGSGGLWPRRVVDTERGELIPDSGDYHKYFYYGKPEKSDALPEEHPDSTYTLRAKLSDFAIVVAGTNDGPLVAGLGRSYGMALVPPIVKPVSSPLCP